MTSFVDGSQIYTPNEVDAKALRGKDGKLKTNANFYREMLPYINGSLMAGYARLGDNPDNISERA